MEKLYNIFKNRIEDITDIKIDIEESCEYPIEVTFDNILLCDKLTNNTCTAEKIMEIKEFYNTKLWNDYVLLTLMVRYTHHIKLYNEEGWKRRGDFTTPELYKAFIKGIETTIRGYILETINVHMTDIEQTNNIKEPVLSRMELLSKPE